MTNDKTKIANLFLGNTKKYSKYRLFDEPVATKIVEISSGPDSEAILKTKEDDKQEYTMDVINDDAVSTGSVIVSKLVKRACKKYTVNSLFGLPRAVILAIYQNCKLTGTNVTNEITMDHLVAMIGNNKSCIKTTIGRLKAKHLLSTEAYKTGRGGWAIYRLSEDLYRDIAKMEASRRTRTARKSR
jgi:predicted transcriptional regulator